jgi:uncharacterized protein YndB with AHSA1/START domain
MTDELDPERDLVLERDIAAPRDMLFQIWTTPEHLVHWFVPKPHKVIACDLDPRPGGACNTTFDVEGQIIENNGVYLEVIHNQKLVFTDAYTRGWKPAPEPFMTAIVTFQDAKPGHTLYRAVARHRSAETARQHAEMGFHEGWGIVATQMEAYALTLLRGRTA